MWVVSTSDGRRMEFFGFHAARSYLLDELWWAAEDDRREEYLSAWAEVATWDSSGKGWGETTDFSISVLGVTYRLFKQVPWTDEERRERLLP